MTKKEANTSSSSTALHPAQTVTNIKTHVPLTLDLEKVRYETWAELFQVVARAHSVIDHLDGRARPPNGPAPPTDEWTQIDAIVLSWIYGTVSHDLLLAIVKPGSTARDAWLRVKAAGLERQFDRCELAEFPDVNSYCQRLKSLADQLSDAGNAVSDQRLVLQLVKGLTPGYESLGKAISCKQPLPSFLVAQGILSIGHAIFYGKHGNAIVVGNSGVQDGVAAATSSSVTARTDQKTDVGQKRKLDAPPYSSVFQQTHGANRGYGVGSYASPFGIPDTDSTKRRNGANLGYGVGSYASPTGIPGSDSTKKCNGANLGYGVGSYACNGANLGYGVGSCASPFGIPSSDSTKKCVDMLRGPDGELPAKLRSVEPYLIERISNEIMNHDPYVRWEDIAGLQYAKKCLTEMIVWPLLRPDIFKGCRSPGRGLLLFGPPGTGKTMIGKAIAGEAKATFFCISASSVVGKWMGESEKLVRALFGVASCRQPAVIFVDEIDSLMSRRSDGDHDVTRRMKTQFLIEMEGCDTGNEQILLIGATNRPQDLDEAARRRLTKRLYIPLPSSEARAWIIRNLLEKDGLFKLSTEDIDSICKLTEGYSGSDMKNLVKDASMGPLREAFIQGTDITDLKKEDLRAVTLQDFENALQEVRPSVSLNELGSYEDWDSKFGSFSPSTMQPRSD